MLTRARLREKMTPFVRRFRGIAQTSRLSIVYLLAHEPMDARTLASHLALAENLVLHHIKQLMLSGWVRKIRIDGVMKYQIREKVFTQYDRVFREIPHAFIQ